MDGLGNPLTRWAEALAAAGVRRIEGRIIGDDDRTDDEPYPEGWDVTHVTTETYAPAIGGLSTPTTCSACAIQDGPRRVEPGRLRDGPPRDGAPRRARDDGRGARGRLSIRRALGSDEFSVSGSIAGRAATFQLPVANPTRYAVHAFAARLAAAGIDVSQATLWDVDDLDRKPDYGTAEPLLVSVSPTLARIIEHTNKESDNLYAEHLLRALTPEGSAEAGVAARARLPVARRRGARRGPLAHGRLGPLAQGPHHARGDGGAAAPDAPPPGRAPPSSRRCRPAAGPAARSATASRRAGPRQDGLDRVRALPLGLRHRPGRPDARLLDHGQQLHRSSGSRITGAMDGIVRALATGRRPDTTVGPDEED